MVIKLSDSEWSRGLSFVMHWGMHPTDTFLYEGYFLSDRSSGFLPCRTSFFTKNIDIYVAGPSCSYSSRETQTFSDRSADVFSFIGAIQVELNRPLTSSEPYDLTIRHHNIHERGLRELLLHKDFERQSCPFRETHRFRTNVTTDHTESQAKNWRSWLIGLISIHPNMHVEFSKWRSIVSVALKRRRRRSRWSYFARTISIKHRLRLRLGDDCCASPALVVCIANDIFSWRSSSALVPNAIDRWRQTRPFWVCGQSNKFSSRSKLVAESDPIVWIEGPGKEMHDLCHWFTFSWDKRTWEVHAFRATDVQKVRLLHSERKGYSASQTQYQKN